MGTEAGEDDRTEAQLMAARVIEDRKQAKLLWKELRELGPGSVRESRDRWSGWRESVVDDFLEEAEAGEKRAHRSAAADRGALTTGAQLESNRIAKLALGVAALSTALALVALLKSFGVF